MKTSCSKHAAAVAMIVAALLAGCGEKPETMLKSAKEHLAKNERAVAVIELRNALEKNPNLAEARYLLGKAELETGQFAGAQKELRTALELKYPPDEVIPPLAEAILLTGEFKKVIDEFGTSEVKTPEVSADLPAPLAAAMQQMGVVASKGPDKSNPFVMTTPEARAALQTTLGRAQLALGNVEGAKTAFAAAIAAKPDHPPAMLSQAGLAASSGDLPGAFALIERALAKAPTLSEGWKLKGDLLKAEGKNDEALDAYRQSINANAYDLASHSTLVSTLIQQGKMEEAGRQLAGMQKIAPRHPQTLYLQALLAFGQQKYPEARDAMQQHLKVAPDNPVGLLLSASINYELGAYTQVEAELRKVLKQSPNQRAARRLLAQTYLRTNQPRMALEMIAPLLAQQDLDADTLSLIGSVYAQNGDNVKSAKYFERSLALDPTSPSKRTSLALANLAKSGNGQGFQELEEAAAADPGIRADIALIVGNMRQKKFDAALDAVATLEKKQPDSALPLTLRGGVLLANRDFAGARRSFEQASAKDPAYFPAAANLARLDLDDNKPDDARKRFETVLTKDPKSVTALLAVAALRAQAGAPPDEVAELIAKAAAADPNDPRPRVALISHHIRTNQPKLAVTAAQVALAAMPDRPEIIEAVGRAYKAAGNTNQALTMYGKLAQLQPNSPLAFMRMAGIQLDAGDKVAALDNVRKALAIKPDLVAAQRLAIALEVDAGKAPAALAIAREMQKQRPKESVGYLLEGDVGALKGAWGDAAAAYRNGLKVVGTVDLAVRLYLALGSAGNMAEAGKVATSWLKDHPNDNNFRHFLSEQALTRKDLASAATQYKTILEHQPNDAMALNNLAWIAGQLKDPKAIEYAEKADALAPNTPSVMGTLGVLLVEKGETKRGVELLQKAVGLAPNAAPIRLELARALVKDGQKDVAKKELAVLAKLGDKFGDQAEVAKLIQGL